MAGGAGTGTGAGAGAGAGACAGGQCRSLLLLRILAEGQAFALCPIPRQLKHRTTRDKRTNMYFFKIRMLHRKNKQGGAHAEFLFQISLRTRC